jgi:hypothetical protein
VQTHIDGVHVRLADASPTDAVQDAAATLERTFVRTGTGTSRTSLRKLGHTSGLKSLAWTRVKTKLREFPGTQYTTWFDRNACGATPVGVRQSPKKMRFRALLCITLATMGGTAGLDPPMGGADIGRRVSDLTFWTAGQVRWWARKSSTHWEQLLGTEISQPLR